MPKTRQRVYIDTETAKNCHLYKKTEDDASVANVNKTISQAVNAEDSTKTVRTPKRKSTRNGENPQQKG